MRHQHFTLIALLTFWAAAPEAQQDKADIFIKAEMQRQNIPGLSLVVLKDGRIIKAAGYGVANVDLKTAAAPDTVYKIASVSKQFIASGIMLLVQDGKVALNDPIRKYLQRSPNEWKPITVRHLLTHTSGLPRDAPGFDPSKVVTDAELIKTAYRTPLRFAVLARDSAALRPSGAFLSSVVDLAKWDAALHGDTLLSESTRRLMWTPVTLNNGSSHPYGFGWELGSYRDRRLVYHSGSLPGFRAQLARFVDDNVTVIVLMNLDDVDADAIVRGVATFYLP